MLYALLTLPNGSTLDARASNKARLLCHLPAAAATLMGWTPAPSARGYATYRSTGLPGYELHIEHVA